MISINIDMNNSAFEGNSRSEIIRILHKLADDIAEEKNIEIIRDLNGNKVGSVELI